MFIGTLLICGGGVLRYKYFEECYKMIGNPHFNKAVKNRRETVYEWCNYTCQIALPEKLMKHIVAIRYIGYGNEFVWFSYYYHH